MSKFCVNVIGAGLAGSELAFQLASRGVEVRLFEMRPHVMTPAHKTGLPAELVCSNTFKSLSLSSAPGIFKEELKELGSLILHTAPQAQVPAGEALAVDRIVFAESINQALAKTNRIERISCQVDDLANLPRADFTVIATGPLTQGKLADYIANISKASETSGSSNSSNDSFYFYDAIAPVIDAQSINYNIVFSASRYQKGSGADYLNCPFSKEEYLNFYQALMTAEKVGFHDFEEAKYFQGCQPIEAIAETGIDSPRFGPMKPVGLIDPRTNHRPYAVVQLRIDNLSRSAYNMVGFQTKLKYEEQKKVFRLIPGLEKAEFLRLGSMHRNTYICTPTLLDQTFSLKTNRNIKFAGQITGVEGYTESAAIGLLTASAIINELEQKKWTLPPRHSALGNLCHYLFHTAAKDFQPINVHFGLFESFDDHQNKKLSKSEKRFIIGQKAIANIKEWKNEIQWVSAFSQF